LGFLWLRSFGLYLRIDGGKKDKNRMNDDYDQVWRNCRWGRNSQYLKHDEVQSFFPKLWKLLQAYASAFDDKWAYRKTDKYVLRFPVWDKPQSGNYWEDQDKRREDIYQQKLA